MLMTVGLLLFGVFVLVTGIQLFYYLYFFRRLAFYKNPPPRSQSLQHPVSVVICARDEAANLAQNLPTVLEQQYPTTHEVIVVNDNSFDESRYLLGDLQKQHRKLNIIDLTQEAKLIDGKKFPLSVGIKEARHEVLLLTDADCAPASENWMYKMQDAFGPGVEVALGYGAYIKQPGLLNKLIRFETFHTALQYLSYALAGKPYMGVGRNLAYRRGTFFRNKGFASINHVPSGDDDLFINKVATRDNTTVVLDPEAFTLSLPKQTWTDWVRQKTRHYTTGKYYKKSHQAWLGLYTLSFMLFYPLFAASLIFYDWRWALIPLLVRIGVQAIVWDKAMKRLKEADLYPWFVLLDLWMFIYYIIFAPTLWKRPRKSWK
ncbi:glycosyltransferase [Paracnuella aquatica]|nr:glycosyltransferase [Paracnuella aquatica]